MGLYESSVIIQFWWVSKKYRPGFLSSMYNNIADGLQISRPFFNFCSTPSHGLMLPLCNTFHWRTLHLAKADHKSDSFELISTFSLYKKFVIQSRMRKLGQFSDANVLFFSKERATLVPRSMHTRRDWSCRYLFGVLGFGLSIHARRARILCAHTSTTTQLTSQKLTSKTSPLPQTSKRLDHFLRKCVRVTGLFEGYLVVFYRCWFL